MFPRKHSPLRNTILIVILIFFTISFLKILEEVWSKESVITLDLHLANWVYTLRTPLLNSVMLFITSLASPFAIALACLLLAIYFFAKRKITYLVPLLLTVIVNSTFVESVKLLTSRARPGLEHALVIEKTFSFPSGHTLLAVTFYGLLIMYSLYTFNTGYTKIISFILGIFVILSIGFSRIYLGAHWPSDVLASLLIGISWLCVVALCIDYKVEIRRLYSEILYNSNIITKK